MRPSGELFMEESKNNFSNNAHLLDGANDLLNLKRHSLSSMFSPTSVALIGASDRKGSVGFTTFSNLLSGGFKGAIYPVNPTSATIMGKQAYKSVLDIPNAVDIAIITTPAAICPEVVAQCISKGIPSAVIISAGFKETGAEGKKLEETISSLVLGKMRLIGPNCLGIMNPKIGLNATFAQTIAKPGNVAFISQSGALCRAILDWSLRESIGFSGF